jgi:non-ribosomal peptide synthetase component F
VTFDLHFCVQLSFSVAFPLQPLLSVMFTTGVHRIVESHAATRGHEIALVGRDATLTYRELNQRANALARYFIAQGFRRRSRAVVKMERCPELAMVLLAVLKAGGAYTWLDGRVCKRPNHPVLAERSASADPSDQAGWPCGISLEQQADGDEQRHLFIDIRDALDASARPAPNLPILTRAADIAYVLPQRNGLPGVLVPHAAITALQSHPLRETTDWSSEFGALDLWLPLMAGATVRLTTAPSQPAAA